MHIIWANVNCGYRGPAKKQSRGDVLTMAVLLLLGVLPGLLYAIIYYGHRYSRPQCGMQVSSDN